MTVHSSDLSPEKLADYRRVALHRQKERIAKTKSRLDKGWELARKAARLLREEYRAGRIVVFGSLLHESRFTEWSDVDIAAWGIPTELTFKAIGAVMDLDPSIEVNLVDVNTCPESLLKNIQAEGIDL